MRISVELSDEQVQHIERALRRCRFDKLEDSVNTLAQLAIASWVDWLSGEKRYTSLTQQYTDWIEAIYLHLLPEDEPPSIDRLYNSFNIPFGQAQYITRVLSNKTLTHWRQRAVERLKSAMEKKLDDVNEWVKRGDATLKAEIIIDKLSYLELKSICDRLFQQNPDEIIPPEYSLAGSLYSVRIPATCFRKIYEAIEF